MLNIPTNRFVKILSCDANGLFAFFKPPGLLSHPNDTTIKSQCLIDAPYNHGNESYSYKISSKTEKLWLLNRLDSATSGIVIGTTNQTLAEIVKRQFRKRLVKKCYNAVVFGDVMLSTGRQHMTWMDLMTTSKNGANVRALSGSDKEAVTNVSVLEYNRHYNTTMLQLNPVTGFTHQLRFQCAAHGFPIVGDKVYGDFDANKVFSASWLKTQKQHREHSLCIADNSRSDGGTVISDIGACGAQSKEGISSSKHGAGASASKSSSKRMYLHSHSIDFQYVLDGIEYDFGATSEIPTEFHLLNTV